MTPPYLESEELIYRLVSACGCFRTGNREAPRPYAPGSPGGRAPRRRACRTRADGQVRPADQALAHAKPEAQEEGLAATGAPVSTGSAETGGQVIYEELRNGQFSSPARRAHEGPGLPLTTNRMAWRPYENLIDGELDNRTPGKVTGWMRFFRRGKSPLRVTFDLAGDFHEDIRGAVIRLRNPEPSDRSEQLGREGTYMEGFARVQRGTVGDITAGIPLSPWTDELAENLMAQNEILWDENGVTGPEREERRREFARRYREHIEAGDLYYPYVSYPYVEWYSDRNGRVVLELDPSQVEILGISGVAPLRMKTPRELVEDGKRRSAAFGAFMSGLVRNFSRENRTHGGDGNVTGVVVG